MKKYPKYKDSGIEWLGDIPIHWELKKLKWVANIYGGSTPATSKEEYWNGNINWATTDDLGKLHSKYITTTKRKITDAGLNNIGKSLAPAGSLVISNRAPIGHIGILKVDAATNQGCKSIVLNKNLSSKFYYNLLLIAKDQLDSLGRGTTFKELSTQSLKDFTIVFPSESEQTTIANVLDHKTQLIDDLIAKKERLIELLKEERTAIINQAVTKGLDPNVPMKDSGVKWLGEIPEHWGVKRLAYVGEFSKGSGISKSDLTDEGVPVLLYGDIYTQYDIVVNIFVRYTSINIVESAKEVYQNDLLLTGSGETAEDIGKCVVYTGSERAYAGGDVIILRPYKYNGLFISYVLNSDYLINEKAKLAKGGIIVHIYSSQLRNIFIPIPPINEQNKIINYLYFKLKTIKDSIKNTNNQIILLEEYKTSLINEAVTGKIKVS